MTIRTGYLNIRDGDIHRLRVRDGASLYEITLNGARAGDIRAMPQRPALTDIVAWDTTTTDKQHVDIGISDGRVCRVDLSPLVYWLDRSHDTAGTEMADYQHLGALPITVTDPEELT